MDPQRWKLVGAEGLDLRKWKRAEKRVWIPGGGSGLEKNV